MHFRLARLASAPASEPPRHRVHNPLLVMALALSLGGCASVLAGTSQQLLVNTNPEGANCALNRKGATLARINPTPGAATISKTKEDITIVCEKSGYQQATFIDASGIQPATWGNLAVGGLVGWGIDSATGADDHYDSPVNITLVPSAPRSPPVAPAPTAPAAVPVQAATKPPPSPGPDRAATPSQAPNVAPLARRDPVRFSDEAPFRCPPAGTEIDFRSGMARFFAATPNATAPDCSSEAANGTAAVTPFGVYRSASEDELRKLWPLQVGKTVSFVNATDTLGHVTESFRVAGHELVTVPAGTYDTFVIKWEASSTNAYAAIAGYHETATFWYAPEIGFIVKIKHHLEGGLYARFTNDEAVRVTAQ
jgi:hypothetical protein